MAINTKLGQNTFKDSKAALSGLGQKSGWTNGAHQKKKLKKDYWLKCRFPSH